MFEGLRTGDTTIDGYPVEIGMRVWDYDLRRAVVVGPEDFGNPNEPTWYKMTSGEPEREGKPSSSMDAKRMWKFHPTTKERA